MTPPLLAELRDLPGDAHVLAGADTDGHPADEHRRLAGRSLAAVRPSDAAQAARLVRLARRHGAPIVPRGGDTGLMGAATPHGSGRAVVLSLARMNRVRGVDPDNDTLTVEAGAVRADVQRAARAANRLLPLGWGSEGGCTIGGHLAIDARGTQVLRYGDARELVIGLEAMTAEGEVWNGLLGLRKDDAGYALRDLHVGREGTPGIITAAALKLHPLPRAHCAALLAFGCIRDAVAFLGAARAGFGGGPTAFELMSDTAMGLVAQHMPEQPLPPTPGAPWFALVELSDADGEERARERFEAAVGRAFEDGLVADAAVAESLPQREALWRLRDRALGEAQRLDRRNVEHDVSVPVSRIPDFLAATAGALQVRFPGVRPLVFGRLGDGNLHYNVSHAPGGSPADVFAEEDAIHEVVHDGAHAHGGSISAEHGIGQTERDQLTRCKSADELDLMRRLKSVFDPLGLLNPDKVLLPATAPPLLHSEESPAP